MIKFTMRKNKLKFIDRYIETRLYLPVLLVTFEQSNIYTKGCLDLLLLNMILKEVMSGTFFAPISYNHGRTSDHFPLIALGIKFTKSSIFAQLHVVWNSQKKIFNNSYILKQSWNKFTKYGNPGS